MAKKSKGQSLEATALALEASSAPTAKIDVFHHFPDLPYEIKSMIVELLCTGPRDVTLWCNRSWRKQRRFPAFVDGPSVLMLAYSTTTPAPAILHVNQELRGEALRFYSLAFGTKGFGGIVVPPNIYINW